MRILLVSCLVLLCAVPALGDAIDDVESAAAEAAAAAKEGDAAALKRVAEAKSPGAWRVVEELCVLGELDAADAIAKVSPENEREALIAYAATRRTNPIDKAHRQSHTKVYRAVKAGDVETALKILRAMPELPPSVLSVDLGQAHGAALQRKGETAQAIETYGNAGLIAKEIGWTDQWVKRCFQAGDLSLRSQDLAAGERWYETAYEAAKISGVELYIAHIGVRLAICYSQRGRNAEALALNQAMLPLYEKAGDKRALGTLQTNIGTDLIILGRLEEALAMMTPAVEALEAAGAHGTVAMTLGNMSAIYTRLGDWDTALRMKRDALERHRVLGNEAEIGKILSGIADVYRQIGDYAAAFTHYEEALQRHKTLGNKQGIGFTLGRMGLAHAHLGNREKAFDQMQEALRWLDESGAERIADHVRISLADLYRLDEQYKEALDLQKQVLARREGGGNLTGISDAHQTIATTYGYMGKESESLAHLEKALDFAKKAKNAASIAYAEISYADHYAGLGKYDEASKYLDAAMAYAAAHGDHLLENAIHETRVEAAIAAGKHAAAVDTALAAAEALRKQFRNLGHEERARAGERWMKALVLGVESALSARKPEAAFQLLEAGRASALREALGGGTALRAAVVPDELRQAGAKAREAETSAANRLRAALEGDAKLAEIKALREALADARKRLEAVAVKMERTAKAAADVVQPRPVSLADSQRLIGKGRTLLMFTAQGDEASALVVREKGLRHVALGPSKEIREACAGLYADEKGTINEDAAAKLRKLLIAPLGLGSKDKRVWVSPDGPVAYVPFALLLKDREVTYVPSASTAVQLATLGEERGEGVLALGDPSYGDAPVPGGASLRSGFRLVPLPATRVEAKAVGDVVLLGEKATESAFGEALKQRQRWRAVHFACHGLVDPQRPSFCALALTAEEGSDGFLTALEVLRSRIPADLVVLSACETGRGKVYDGEGIVGLTRAFMLAGAPRVLVSLWKVDDEATRVLMEAFYAQWKQGKGAAAALRAAQEYLRSFEKTTVDAEASRKAGRTIQAKTKPYADPRFWAGWVLWGVSD